MGNNKEAKELSVSAEGNRNRQCYEMVEYTKSLPFRIHNITDKTTWDEQGNIINILADRQSV